MYGQELVSVQLVKSWSTLAQDARGLVRFMTQIGHL